MKPVAYRAHAAGPLLGGGAADDEIGLGRAIAVDQPDAGALLERDVEIGRNAGRQARSGTCGCAPPATARLDNKIGTMAPST